MKLVYFYSFRTMSAAYICNRRRSGGA